MAQRIALLLGTPKGAFVLDGTTDRQDWRLRGPLCEGWPTHDISVEPGTGALLAGGGSPWYGPAVWRSPDLGATWSHSSEGMTYGDEGPKVKTVWNVTAAHGTIYAGVEPAGLFRSTDGGTTWQHVEGLTNHPTRPEWQPGNGGLILHSIVPHRTDPARLWVGISAVGAFETKDGGVSWETRNKGVRADFNPDNRYPEFGQCVHKLAMAADGGEHLYQQNHCGVYRSFDGGRQWEEITSGLPSEFGFPMVAHPRDPQTVWTIPLTPPELGRFMPDASVAVWRTHDGGGSWARSGEGLPQRDAYVGVLREAMAVDALDPVGVYFGTSTGQVYGSADEGRTWALVAAKLSADLVRRGGGRWLNGDHVPESVAPAVVHLPRSLIALFPGAPRRLDAHGVTVAEILDDLERQVPGLRNRLLDAGPTIRDHINIFVSGERAALDTPVPPGAAVHVIPAVSGG